MTRPYTGRHRTDNRRHDRLQIVKDQASVVLVTRRNRNSAKSRGVPCAVIAWSVWVCRARAQTGAVFGRQQLPEGSSV